MINMKIKISKNSGMMKAILDYDRKRYRDYGSFNGTWFSDYSPTWVEEDVTMKQLKEYINAGYSIKINC